MEKLIAFVTQNPFILIIIVGLLYSMFFRKSPIEKQPGQRPGSKPGNGPNRMPNFGGSPVFAPKTQRTDVGTPARQPEIRPSFGGLEDSAPQPGGNPYMHVPEPTSSIETPRAPSYSLQERSDPARPERHRAAPARVSLVESAETSHALAVSDGINAGFTSDDFRQAVVWAEIIGPPRAKRPYNRR